MKISAPARAPIRQAVLAVAMLLAGAVANAATPDDFAYGWPLATDAQSSAYQIELTPEVYAALVDPQLRDLAVFNAAGDTVPLQSVAPYNSRAIRHEGLAPLPIFTIARDTSDDANDDVRVQIERDADGRLRRMQTEAGKTGAASKRTDYLLDASAIAAPIESLWLRDRANAAPLNAQFAVDGSEDLQHWRVLVDAASVVDLHQGDATLVRQQIPLPATKSKYLRLRRLDNGPALPQELTVTGRVVSLTTLQHPARTWIDVPLTSQDTNLSTATTVSGAKSGRGYVYTLPGSLDIEALRIALSEDNSIAELAVFTRPGGSDAAKAWSPRLHLTAFRLRQDGALLSNDEISQISSARPREWRIETTQPLGAAPTLRIGYRPDRLVFLAQGAPPFRLAAGQYGGHRVDYPVDAALTQLRATLGADWQPPLVTLGARQTQRGAAATTPPPPEPAPYPWKSWLLWGVLIGGAALVGFMALQLLKDAQPPKP